MRIIKIVVAQHAEDAAFQWLLRDAAVRAPHYSLSDLADLDNRVEAHLDGLRIAGDEGWHLCAEGLQSKESGEVFAAALIAFGTGMTERITEVCGAVEAAPETVRGLISALGWLPRQRLPAPVAGFLTSEDPLWRRVAIAAYAIHRVDPREHLAGSIADPDADLRARALRAAGELGRVDLMPALQTHFGSDEETCRFWAAWSAVLLGIRGQALAVLSKLATADSPLAERATLTLMRAANPNDAHTWLSALVKRGDRQRRAIIGCGAAGDPAYVPWLIEQMRGSSELARVAGEAFSMITGADIAYEDLDGDWPEAFEAGPTENPEDEDVAMDADEDLPWPDPQRIERWWQGHRADFASGQRYLAGQPISDAHCQRVLRTGFQRQRIAAALELALLRPEAPLFETRAPGFRQQRLLGVGR
jgi:uncharacterized protein (TIGR02270 family)